MALQVKIHPLLESEPTTKIHLPQGNFYFIHDAGGGTITAARSLSDTEGAAIYHVDNYYDDPATLNYWDAMRLFNEQTQIERILPWMSKTLLTEAIELGYSEVVFRHRPDMIVFLRPSSFSQEE